MKRRHFITRSGQLALGAGFLTWIACNDGQPADGDDMADSADDMDAGDGNDLFFNISLAQWSLHKALRAGTLDNLDFVRVAKEEFGINGVEYVNQFFMDKATDTAYLDQMNEQAAKHGVKNLLIMIDGEGNLGDADEAARAKAVQNHHKWIDAAKYLGCHSIRVNAGGQGTAEEVAAQAMKSLSELGDYGAQAGGINVLVENHGGYSSNAKWLADLMAAVNKSNVGTLPDFGNFCIKRDGANPWQGNCVEEYDRYQGVQELMPYAKAVSAKSHDFDDSGKETHTDYVKMLKIVKDAGYDGWIGIEYEGDELDEMAGIKATKELLLQAGREVTGSS